MFLTTVFNKNVEDGYKCLQPVSMSLDQLQRYECCVADAVDIWKKLLENFRDMGTEGHEWLEVVEKRYENSVPALWFLAYLLHPSYGGDALTQKEIKDAKSYAIENYPELMSDFITYLSCKKEDIITSFKKLGNCKASDYLKSLKITGELDDGISTLAMKLLTLPPSSAAIERVFSTLGFVHSDVRNRLGQEKAVKLAFVLRALPSDVV